MQDGVLLTVRSVTFHQFDPHSASRHTDALSAAVYLCSLSFLFLLSEMSLMFKKRMQMQITSHALYSALESSDVTWKIPTQLQMCHQ